MPAIIDRSTKGTSLLGFAGLACAISGGLAYRQAPLLKACVRWLVERAACVA